MMNAPRVSVVFPITTAQYCEQHSRAVLKPSMSCSAPKTRMLLALRAAGLSGTPGIAGKTRDGFAACVLSAVLTAEVIAPAAATSIRLASAAPANSQIRLCIFPPFRSRREPRRRRLEKRDGKGGRRDRDGGKSGERQLAASRHQHREFRHLDRRRTQLAGG